MEPEGVIVVDVEAEIELDWVGVAVPDLEGVGLGEPLHITFELTVPGHVFDISVQGTN